MEEKLSYILVIDDEPDMCWALENILGSVGYTVTTATNGTQALGLLTARQPPYAVAFVDAKLPDIDGLELAALIRHHSPRTTVIFISGYYYQEDSTIIEGLQEGLFVGFVAKPFDLHQVRLMAREAVERSERTSS